MSTPLQIRAEIAPFLFRRKFLLAYGMHSVLGRPEGPLYWNHADSRWMVTPEEATAFDTQAGTLVYRRGNLLRMQMALDDVLARS